MVNYKRIVLSKLAQFKKAPPFLEELWWEVEDEGVKAEYFLRSLCDLLKKEKIRFRRDGSVVLVKDK